MQMVSRRSLYEDDMWLVLVVLFMTAGVINGGVSFSLVASRDFSKPAVLR